MPLEISFAGNVDENRVDAEICFETNRWFSSVLNTAALVYLHKGEFQVEVIDPYDDQAELESAIEKAKSGLLQYRYPEGVEIEDDVSRAGLALTLLTKLDGTAMGVKIEGDT